MTHVQFSRKSSFRPYTSQLHKAYPSTFETVQIISRGWLCVVLKVVLSFSFLFNLAEYLEVIVNYKNHKTEIQFCLPLYRYIYIMNI
jgi:hypothetical protein